MSRNSKFILSKTEDLLAKILTKLTESVEQQKSIIELLTKISQTASTPEQIDAELLFTDPEQIEGPEE